MGLLPGSQDPDTQWVEVDYAQKSRFHDKIQNARKAYPGTLNPTAYCLASSATYLGMRGPFYTALPYGHDSSNIQAIINMPAYWQRVYWKKDGLKEMGVGDLEDNMSQVSAVAPEKASRPSSAPCRRSSESGKAAVKQGKGSPRSVVSSTSAASSVLRRALRSSSATGKHTMETQKVSTSTPQLNLGQMTQTEAASDAGSRRVDQQKAHVRNSDQTGIETEISPRLMDSSTKARKKRPASAPVKRSACSENGSTVSANSKASSLESYLKKKRPSSASSRSSTPALGLDAIRKSMHPIVMTAGKPKLGSKIGYGEQFNFHNTLGAQKYSLKAGAGPKTFDYDKLGHRSSKHEVAFMQSLRWRMDLDCVLDQEKVIAQGPLK